MYLFNLQNKVAVVFGGNGVLGLQFCKALLKYGARVISCDIVGEDNADVILLKEGFTPNFTVHTIDASDKDELIELKNEIFKREGRVDILINSTTMKHHDFYLPFEDVSLEGWNIGLLGNLTIPFLTIQTFIPIMKNQKCGSIINIGSVYGILGNDQRIYDGSNLDMVYTEKKISSPQIKSHGVYNAAKGGLISFTRYLAAYYGEYNIRVNCISPGGITNKNEDEIFIRKYSEKVPLGRKAFPDEINGAIIFLASDASSYITGHNLVVDGGFSIW